MKKIIIFSFIFVALLKISHAQDVYKFKLENNQIDYIDIRNAYENSTIQKPIVLSSESIDFVKLYKRNSDFVTLNGDAYVVKWRIEKSDNVMLKYNNKLYNNNITFGNSLKLNISIKATQNYKNDFIRFYFGNIKVLEINFNLNIIKKGKLEIKAKDELLYFDNKQQKKIFLHNTGDEKIDINLNPNSEIAEYFDVNPKQISINANDSVKVVIDFRPKQLEDSYPTNEKLINSQIIFTDNNENSIKIDLTTKLKKNRKINKTKSHYIYIPIIVVLSGAIIYLLIKTNHK